MDGDLRQLLGEVVAGQRHLCARVESMERRIDGHIDALSEEVARNSRRLTMYESARNVLMWVFGAVVAFWGLLNGMDWFKSR